LGGGDRPIVLPEGSSSNRCGRRSHHPEGTMQLQRDTVRATERPLIVHACHCRDCQRITGSAFVVNMWIEKKFVRASGAEPKAYRLGGGSGKRHDAFFCDTCGPYLWSRYHIVSSDCLFVRAGTLENPGAATPDVHIFTRTKVAWLTLPKRAGIPVDLQDHIVPERLEVLRDPLALGRGFEQDACSGPAAQQRGEPLPRRADALFADDGAVCLLDAERLSDLGRPRPCSGRTSVRSRSRVPRGRRGSAVMLVNRATRSEGPTRKYVGSYMWTSSRMSLPSRGYSPSGYTLSTPRKRRSAGSRPTTANDTVVNPARAADARSAAIGPSRWRISGRVLSTGICRSASAGTAATRTTSAMRRIHHMDQSHTSLYRTHGVATSAAGARSLRDSRRAGIRPTTCDSPRASPWPPRSAGGEGENPHCPPYLPRS